MIALRPHALPMWNILNKLILTFRDMFKYDFIVVLGLLKYPAGSPICNTILVSDDC